VLVRLAVKVVVLVMETVELVFVAEVDVIV